MHHAICAIDTLSNKYVFPTQADKSSTYTCPECSKEVIPRKGNVRKHHFAHKASTDPCSYFDRPSESQQHKIAKIAILSHLENGNMIYTTYKCPVSYDKFHICETYIKLYEDDIIQLEYRDTQNKYVADIAILNKGTPRILIEIYHTHNTTTCTRPEPWYEFSTSDVLDSSFEKQTHLQCLRNRENVDSKCEYCRLGDFYLGAIDKPTGGFCLPLRKYEHNELICQYCSQPVKLQGRMFQHIEPSKCLFYNYPTDDQIKTNLIHSLANLIQEEMNQERYSEKSIVLSFEYSCSSTYFAGGCSNVGEYSMNYEKDDIVYMNLKKNYIRVKNKDGIKYELIICDEDECKNGIEYNKLYIYAKTKLHKLVNDRFIIDLCNNGFCFDCKIINDNTQYFDKLPKFRTKWRGETSTPCILCNKLYYMSLYINGFYRPLCFDCMCELDIDSNLEKIKTYKPKPLFTED